MCARPQKARMLLLSLVLLVIAALFGGALAGLRLRTERPTAPRWPFGALHGLLGLAGFVTLLLALPGPPRGEAVGVASFGRIAAVLLATAIFVALALLVMRRPHRETPGLVIGIH